MYSKELRHSQVYIYIHSPLLQRLLEAIKKVLVLGGDFHPINQWYRMERERTFNENHLIWTRNQTNILL